MNIRQWFKNRKEREVLSKDWCLVLQYHEEWQRGSTDFTLYFNLYENGIGDRKYESFRDNPNASSDLYLRSRFFITVVKPWLTGARVLKVPTYEEAKSQLVVDLLSR